MAILNDVKQALGVFYSEPIKEMEITGIINGAKAFLKQSGWPESDLVTDEEGPLAKQAIILYAKMAINTDPTEMRVNPMLVAMIAQARAEQPVTEDASNED